MSSKSMLHFNAVNNQDSYHRIRRIGVLYYNTVDQTKLTVCVIRVLLICPAGPSGLHLPIHEFYCISLFQTLLVICPVLPEFAHQFLLDNIPLQDFRWKFYRTCSHLPVKLIHLPFQNFASGGETGRLSFAFPILRTQINNKTPTFIAFLYGRVGFPADRSPYAGGLNSMDAVMEQSRVFFIYLILLSQGRWKSLWKTKGLHYYVNILMTAVSRIGVADCRHLSVASCNMFVPGC